MLSAWKAFAIITFKSQKLVCKLLKMSKFLASNFYTAENQNNVLHKHARCAYSGLPKMPCFAHLKCNRFPNSQPTNEHPLLQQKKKNTTKKQTAQLMRRCFGGAQWSVSWGSGARTSQHLNTRNKRFQRRRRIACLTSIPGSRLVHSSRLMLEYIRVLHQPQHLNDASISSFGVWGTCYAA